MDSQLRFFSEMSVALLLLNQKVITEGIVKIEISIEGLALEDLLKTK